MATGNGAHVTWRELNLVLAPIDELKDEVRGLSKQVGSLREEFAEARGASDSERRVSDRALAWAGVIGVCLTAVATVVWLLVG